jgi:hypothetical protein
MGRMIMMIMMRITKSLARMMMRRMEI